MSHGLPAQRPCRNLACAKMLETPLAQTRYHEFPGDHFTVIDPLADPSSAMVARIAELTQQVSR